MDLRIKVLVTYCDDGLVNSNDYQHLLGLYIRFNFRVYTRTAPKFISRKRILHVR